MPEMQRRIAERAKSLAPGRRASRLLEVAASWSATAARSASTAEAGKGTVVGATARQR